MLRISAKSSNRAAMLRPARTPAIAVSTARLLLRRNPHRPHSSHRSWSETSTPGCGPTSGPRPVPLVAVRKDLRSVIEDSEQLACAGATAPPNHQRRQTAAQLQPACRLSPTFNRARPPRHSCSDRRSQSQTRQIGRWRCHRLAAGCHGGCFRCFTQHTLCVRSHGFLLNSNFRLRRGIELRTMWRCVHHRCFSVTVRAEPGPRIRPGALQGGQCGTHRASSQASSAPTPPLRLTRNSRVCLPQCSPMAGGAATGSHPPPLPDARPLPSPRGRR